MMLTDHDPILCPTVNGHRACLTTKWDDLNDYINAVFIDVSANFILRMCQCLF